MPNFSNMDLTEIVFLYRNKEYGAYQLRRSYVRNTALGLGIGTGILLAAFLIPGIISSLKSNMADDIKLAETEMVLEEPPPMNKEDEPPPPPEAEPPPPPQKSEIQFVPPKVVKDEEAPPEQTIATIDTLQKSEADIGKKNVEGDNDAPPNLGDFKEGGTGTAPVEVAAPVERVPDVDEFVHVQQEPKPANLDEIKKMITYPEMLKEAQIQGKVFVKILVDKEGKPVKHVVKKSPHPLMTQEIESKIYKLKFTPAINAGKPVQFWVSIPFDFKLK